MTFNSKVSLVANGCELIDGKTDIHLYNEMALSAGQVMMMTPATHAVMVRPIGKLNPVEQTHIDQLLYRTIDRCSSQTRLFLSQLMPKVINREIGSACCKFYEPLCNKLSRACMALAHFIESCPNFVCYHFCCTPLPIRSLDYTPVYPFPQTIRDGQKLRYVHDRDAADLYSNEVNEDG